MHRRCLFKFKQSLVMMTKWWYSYSSIDTHQYLDYANTWNNYGRGAAKWHVFLSTSPRAIREGWAKSVISVGRYTTDGARLSKSRRTVKPLSDNQLEPTASQALLDSINGKHDMNSEIFSLFLPKLFPITIFFVQRGYTFFVDTLTFVVRATNLKNNKHDRVCDLYQNIWRDIYVNTNKISVNLKEKRRKYRKMAKNLLKKKQIQSQ